MANPALKEYVCEFMPELIAIVKDDSSTADDVNEKVIKGLAECFELGFKMHAVLDAKYKAEREGTYFHVEEELKLAGEQLAFAHAMKCKE